MKLSSAALALLSLGLPLSPVPAAAADGVLEINQTCATLSGCFAGDAAGFPVTIATAGSYRLTSNLQAPDANTDGVLIMAGPVSLDLGGFAIQGVTVCSGVPVSSCTPTGPGLGIEGSVGVRDISVLNGSVTGTGSAGVSLDFSAQVEGLHVFLNGGDGIAVGNESVVSRNVVTSNFNNGISCNQHCLVGNNTSTGNRLSGISVSSGTVTRNTASSNGGGGGNFGPLTSYAENTFEGNTPQDVVGGHATSGNVCGDGSCTTHGERRYYLTKTASDGLGALTACAPGFHMASLWELLNVSVLRYDGILGETQSDRGFGPPAHSDGWIRTGNASDPGANPGEKNCASWTTAANSSEGTYASLDSAWVSGNTTPGLVSDVPPWESATTSCDAGIRVWCAED